MKSGVVAAAQGASLSRPLLKWAGGKRQLLHQICKRLPSKIETYYEPFVGGGAVFFSLAAQGRFRRAVLSDQNEELIATYRAVKQDVEAVIRELKKMRHSEEDYYEIRAWKPRLLAKRAARMIYLNRTGYNGLYRVNRSGQFNVPFGRYVRPNICDEDRLRAVARAFSGVDLLVEDFSGVVLKSRPGDAVYFDPPYVPVSATAKFAEYHKKAFGDEEQEELVRVYESLTERGVSAVLSNSDTPRTRALYRHLCYERVSARRNINSAADRRGPTTELLVYSSPSASQLAVPRKVVLGGR